MYRLIREEDILENAHEVVLLNKSKKMVFDVTLVKELPEVDPFSCKGCVRDNELRWEDECFECARYHHDWYKRREE